MKRMVTLLLSILLAFTLSLPALAGSLDSEIATASRFLQAEGILQGNASGDLQLEKPLTRAELAVIASRLTVNQEHLMADKTYYSNQCKFTDVPVLLRCCGNLVPFEWSYETALDAAVQYGIAPREALQEQYISRGNLSILLYRTAEKLGFMGDVDVEMPENDGRSPLTKNADGSINVPSDGSQYIPQAGDVIRCDDGTNYTITDTRLYGNSMFAEGQLPPLPTPTCDWSQFPELELPEAEVRHFKDEYGDDIFIRNLYETRRMQYTLYNAIGANPQTWQNGKLVLRSDGSPLARVQLTIPGEDHSNFWPWKPEQLLNYFNSCPTGLFQVQVWDVFSDGVYLRTEYQVNLDIFS